MAAQGEGSRGGKIVGHTKSGHPIYDSAQRVSAAATRVQWKAGKLGFQAYLGTLATGLLTRSITSQTVTKYSKLMGEAGHPVVRKAFMLGAHADFMNHEVVLGSNRDESALLHELGHLKASRVVGSANHTYKDIVSHIASEEAEGKFISPMVKTLMVNAARPFANLPIEYEASKNAIKAAHEVGGIGKAASIGARLVLPYATYAAGATIAAAGVVKFASNRIPRWAAKDPLSGNKTIKALSQSKKGK